MHALIFEHFATNLYDRLSNKLIRTVDTTHEFAYIIYNLHRSINRVQLIEVEIDQVAIDSKLYRLHIRNRNNRDEKSKDDNPILLNANDETSKIGARNHVRNTIENLRSAHWRESEIRTGRQDDNRKIGSSWKKKKNIEFELVNLEEPIKSISPLSHSRLINLPDD